MCGAPLILIWILIFDFQEGGFSSPGTSALNIVLENTIRKGLEESLAAASISEFIPKAKCSSWWWPWGKMMGYNIGHKMMRLFVYFTINPNARRNLSVCVAVLHILRSKMIYVFNTMTSQVCHGNWWNEVGCFIFSSEVFSMFVVMRVPEVVFWK